MFCADFPTKMKKITKLELIFTRQTEGLSEKLQASEIQPQWIKEKRLIACVSIGNDGKEKHESDDL